MAKDIKMKPSKAGKKVNIIDSSVCSIITKALLNTASGSGE